MVFGGLGNALLSPFNRAQEVQHFATKSPLGPPIERHSSSGGYHQSSKSSKKNSNAVAMSALTLLSFFVFLNLLQSCLDEQMNYMKDSMMMTTMAPQTIILARRKQMAREAEKRRGEEQEIKRLEKEPRDNIATPKPPPIKSAKRNLTGITVFRDEHDTEADLKWDDDFTQIPVKLKTAQKYQYPMYYTLDGSIMGIMGSIDELEKRKAMHQSNILRTVQPATFLTDRNTV